MPKLKTKSGAKKRFKVTATGKVKYQQSGKRHGMIKRTTKTIREHRGTTALFKTDGDNIKKYFLPNGRGLRSSLFPFAEFVGDFPWPASNVASPRTRNTRKSLRPPKAITAGARTRSASPSRRSRRRTSTLSATASGASALSARSGSSG